jgi:CBS domain containing-hemolysin-like protein
MGLITLSDVLRYIIGNVDLTEVPETEEERKVAEKGKSL